MKNWKCYSCLQFIHVLQILFQDWITRTVKSIQKGPICTWSCVTCTEERIKSQLFPKLGWTMRRQIWEHRESHHERKGHPSFTDLVYFNSVFVQPSFRVCIRRFWSTLQKYLFWFEMPGVAPGGSLVLWEEIISARRSSSLRAPLTGKSPHIPQASQIPISKLLQIFSRDHIQVTHIILLLTLKGSFLHGLWSVLLQMPQEGRVR